MVFGAVFPLPLLYNFALHFARKKVSGSAEKYVFFSRCKCPQGGRKNHRMKPRTAEDLKVFYFHTDLKKRRFFILSAPPNSLYFIPLKSPVFIASSLLKIPYNFTSYHPSTTPNLKSLTIPYRIPHPKKLPYFSSEPQQTPIKKLKQFLITFITI